MKISPHLLKLVKTHASVLLQSSSLHRTHHLHVHFKNYLTGIWVYIMAMTPHGRRGKKILPKWTEIARDIKLVLYYEWVISIFYLFLLLIQNQIRQYMKRTKVFVQKAHFQMSGQFLFINMQLRHFPSGHLNKELIAESWRGKQYEA